jgi:hypothetical protein
VKIPEPLRVIGRRGRAVLFPMNSVKDHLRYLVRRTGKEFGFQAEIIQYLEDITEETIQESDLSI